METERNMEEWEDAKYILKECIETGWDPHFELVHGDDDDILLLFVLDNDSEWEMFENVPQDYKVEFADSLEEAKEKLLEHLHIEYGEHMTEKEVNKLNNDLELRQQEYERKDGRQLKYLFYNMLLYSEWRQLP